MSKVKAKKSTLAGLIDSDGEEDQLVAQFSSPETSIVVMPAAKKGRAKAKGPAAASPIAPTKVTKPKPASRRLSGRGNGKTNAPAQRKAGRPALADKTNVQHADDEVDDLDVDMEDVEQEPAKKAKGKTGTRKAPVTKGKITKVSAKNAAEDSTAAKQPTKRGRPAKAGANIPTASEKVVPETQMEEDVDADMDIEESQVEEEIDETIIQPKQGKSTKSNTNEDIELRRKLTEMTKKYNTLSSKYDELREIGIKQAEANFDKFKKQTEEKSKASTNLIASMKADLAHQSSLAKDSKALKTKLDSQKLEMATLQVQVADLKASLSTSQADTKTIAADLKTLKTENAALVVENKAHKAEIKTLSAKLAANRTAAASVESVNTKVVPGSAVKVNGGIRMVGTAEAAQLAQAAQLKEHIYSDLTGLIIQGVKREADEDIYNCLQTGRNGTLHFKLSAANDRVSESYADAECSYVPQLDPSRDVALMEKLPDYLTEEISFPRHQAAGFYARVLKALTDKGY